MNSGTLAIARNGAKSLGLDTRALYQGLSAMSLEAAVREQGLTDLRDRCREIIPDLSDQYTQASEKTEYEPYCWRLTRALWKELDFEGFWGAFLEKDLSVADRYQDWA